MANFVNWFEIPATDFERAVTFYTQVLNTPIHSVPVGPMKMGFFNIGKTQRGAFGAIVQGPGYIPSTDGVRITFSCTEPMALYLSRVEAAGGGVVQPRTQLSPEYGYSARFEDSEGNIVGLHSEI